MDKTTQGLKTLAQYMGESPSTENLPTVWQKIIESHGIPLYYPYNTSWDALVPVYAKLFSTEENLFNTEDAFRLTRKIDACIRTDAKQLAFEAVVELVTLINKENGK